MRRLKKFNWHGKSEQGTDMVGEISAYTLNLAKLALNKRGISVNEISRQRESYIFKQSITEMDIIIFFRQLSALISSGITLSQAIHSLTEKANIVFFKILYQLKKDIIAGKEFWLALSSFPQYFDEITCSLIRAGEHSGTLQMILQRLAQHKEKMYLLKKKFKKALFYPGIVFLTAILISLIMIIFIIPRFEELFQSAHYDLPLLTKIILKISYFIRHFFILIIFLCISIVSIIFYFWHFYSVKLFLEKIFFKLTIIKTLATKHILCHFAQNLSTLFSAGIPLNVSLNMLASTTYSLLYKDSIKTLAKEVAAGKALHHAIFLNKLFPALVSQMIKVGEESGTLDHMLEKLALFYENDVDYYLETLACVLEPLIMAVLGVLIGGLVIAMYLPIFKLGTTV